MITAILLTGWAMTALAFAVMWCGYEHELADRKAADRQIECLERLADRAFDFLDADEALDALDLANLDAPGVAPVHIGFEGATA